MYSEIFLRLDLPELAKKCATGKKKVPVYFIEQEPDLYGFLPAMVPLWREDSSYVGYWCHFFCPTGRYTIVQQNPELGYRVQEVARTIDQLVWETIYRQISALPEVDDSERQLSAELGVDVDRLLKLNDKYEGSEDALFELSAFESKRPLSLERDNYDGDFPVSEIQYTPERLRNSCTVEYEKEVLDSIQELDIAPPWFKVEDQASVFYDLLKKKDFLGCWMSLNSNGWEFKDAKKAIIFLAEASQSAELLALAHNWSSCSHEKYISY